MSGLRYLFISSDNKVYKIAAPKNNVYPSVKELHDQLVLEVILYYETHNRKPNQLLYVSFDRLQLNNDGKFIMTELEMEKSSRNFRLFAFETSESLSKIDEPLPLPIAIEAPTIPEKEALKNYIKREIPQTYDSGVIIIEKAIQSIINANTRNINLVKEAAKLRNINNYQDMYWKTNK